MNDGTTTTTGESRTITTIDTPKGQINVIHEITFGDLLLSTVLMATLIFIVLDRMIRR